MRKFVPFSDDTSYAPYIPVPYYIVQEDFSLTAKLIYSIMLGRAISSRKNEAFRDKYGIFINISIKYICSCIGRKESVVKEAINTLVDAGYIKKKRMGRGLSNKYYIYVPADSQKTNHLDSWKSDHQDC